MELRDDGENRGSSEGGQRKGKREDGGRRQTASGKGGRDKVGWFGRVMEEDQKKPMEWACARQYKGNACS